MHTVPVLLLLLTPLLIITLPLWPFNKQWGYYPFFGVVLLILLVIVLAWLKIIR
jgi:hypothetical protein